MNVIGFQTSLKWIDAYWGYDFLTVFQSLKLPHDVLMMPLISIQKLEGVTLSMSRLL